MNNNIIQHTSNKSTVQLAGISVKTSEQPYVKTAQSVFDTTMLYTHIKSDAIKLNRTRVVVNSSGKIQFNPNQEKRINVVRELMDTWYTLSRTLINTASIARLKPEFCEKLNAVMGGSQVNYKEREEKTQAIQIQVNNTMPESDNKNLALINQLELEIQRQSNEIATLATQRNVNLVQPSMPNPNSIYTPEQLKKVALMNIEFKELTISLKRIKLQSATKEARLKNLKLESEVAALQAKQSIDNAKVQESELQLAKKKLDLQEKLVKDLDKQAQAIQSRKQEKETYAVLKFNRTQSEEEYEQSQNKEKEYTETEQQIRDKKQKFLRELGGNAEQYEDTEKEFGNSKIRVRLPDHETENGTFINVGYDPSSYIYNQHTTSNKIKSNHGKGSYKSKKDQAPRKRYNKQG